MNDNYSKYSQIPQLELYSTFTQNQLHDIIPNLLSNQKDKIINCIDEMIAEHDKDIEDILQDYKSFVDLHFVKICKQLSDLIKDFKQHPQYTLDINDQPEYGYGFDLRNIIEDYDFNFLSFFMMLYEDEDNINSKKLIELTYFDNPDFKLGILYIQALKKYFNEIGHENYIEKLRKTIDKRDKRIAEMVMEKTPSEPKPETKYDDKELWIKLLYHTKGKSPTGKVNNIEYKNKSISHQTIATRLNQMKPYLKRYFGEEKIYVYDSLDSWTKLFKYFERSKRDFDATWIDYQKGKRK